jgi:hypothetical protein
MIDGSWDRGEGYTSAVTDRRRLCDALGGHASRQMSKIHAAQFYCSRPPSYIKFTIVWKGPQMPPMARRSRHLGVRILDCEDDFHCAASAT